MVIEATEQLERELLSSGFAVVIGMDEVGRGAIAGPVCVVAAARTVASGPAPPGLRDSKLLSAAQREKMAPIAASWAQPWAFGEASAADIDAHGIVASLRAAGVQALNELWAAGVPTESCVVLLDGTHNWLAAALPAGVSVRVQAKADRDCSIVAAASIIAKVERDRTMQLAHLATPEYGWAGNKGYGSAGHFDAIREHGLHELHRKQWIHQPAGTA